MDWLSLSNTESEANPNNNLMMRRAGLFTFMVYETTTIPMACKSRLARSNTFLGKRFVIILNEFNDVFLPDLCFEKLTLRMSVDHG